MSSSSGNLPADYNVTVSDGGNASAEVRCMLHLICFTFLNTFLLTFLPPFLFLFRDHLACLISSSSSEDSTDRNASGSDGANVPVKVIHICSVSFAATGEMDRHFLTIHLLSRLPFFFY